MAPTSSPSPSPLPRSNYQSLAPRTRPSFPSLPSSRPSATPSSTPWGPSTALPSPPANGARKKSGPSLSLSSGKTDRERDGVKTVHPLKHTWEVWFSNRAATAGNGKEKKGEKEGGKDKESREEWETGVVKLGFFSSIESLHPFLAHLTAPSALPSSLSSTHTLFSPSSPNSVPHSSSLISDLNIFRSPVAPVWEDPSNTGGGRWVLRLRKGVADRVWEEVVWALVGERLEGEDGGREGGRVNGVVLSVRKDEDILSVWCAPCSRAEREFVRDALRLALTPLLTPASLSNLILDYKPHPVSSHSHPPHSHPSPSLNSPNNNHGNNNSTPRRGYTRSGEGGIEDGSPSGNGRDSSRGGREKSVGLGGDGREREKSGGISWGRREFH